MILSAYFAVMLMSWLIMMTIIPFSRGRRLRTFVTSIWCLMSRFEVGSSRRTTGGLLTRPLASITF